MPGNVTRKLIETHLESGEMTPGEEIAIRIDQTLTQDATGTLVMQELEALGLDRARVRPWSARIRTPRRPVRWACWRSVLAGWRSPWPSRGDRCTSGCPRCGVCGWNANCRNGARPRTS